MSWHYQIRQRSDKGELWYDIVEVFDNPTGWTCDGIAPGSETPRGVIQVLQNMLKDAQSYPVLIDQQEV